jgi:glutamate/tyrosine decarboxylase-like PLP-dependent enzyme
MSTDMSMASLLGYFMTMIYNPNNVAIEASPLSTVAEIEVGEQLCELFGYNIDPDNLDAPTSWGHVTCDGTVANLESIWVARNLKFYPLSLREAMEEGNPLEYLSPKFFVETCQGTQKLFTTLTTWEILNMKPNDILDIPDRLYHEYGISNAYLSEIMNKYTIQSTGKDTLESKYGIEKPCQYMVATTRHYSWPKGAAIAGLGSDNMMGIPVDNAAHLDLNALESKLNECLQNQQAVFAVVAIIGSTEEGAVDPLTSVLALRKQFQAKGLSFLVHADAAWGGYFCTMLPKDYRPGDVVNLPTEMGQSSGFIPDATLRAETQEQLYAMRFADSITVDPHKAGYIPYPAGGLCYRDGRLRFLVTWTSPYLSRGSVTSIGIYGVEGSKPGASAMSTWLSNKTIGLNPQGYGALLSEVTWTCTRLSAEWAAMTDSKSDFLCVPFNELPSEIDPETTPAKVDAEKQRIQQEIINKTNSQIMAEDLNRPDDQKAITLLRSLGSDLNINAFSLNFRYSDGTMNEDVEEANYLMQRVVEAFSVESPTENPTKIPLYLTSTEFSDELYGECKAHFMKRLQLKPSTQDLMVLRNVVMSPFPTDGNFLRKLAQIFEEKVREEAEIVRKRNEVTDDFHNFLVQGTEKIYLIHLPMFHVANHRQQLIVSATLDSASLEKYRALKKANPSEPMILVTQHKTYLREIVETEGQFTARIMTKASGMILSNATVSVDVRSVVVSRPLNSQWRVKDYPTTYIPFYLYGTSTDANIDHVIVRAPNTQMSAGQCTVEVDGMSDSHWQKPLLLVIEDVYEAPMQPFPPNREIGSKHGAIVTYKHADEEYDALGAEGSAVNHSDTRNGKLRGSSFFFRPRAKFSVSVWEDTKRTEPSSESARPDQGPLIGRGTLTLGESVFVDSEAMNYDPFKKVEKIAEWRYEFDQIGKELD